MLSSFHIDTCAQALFQYKYWLHKKQILVKFVKCLAKFVPVLVEQVHTRDQNGAPKAPISNCRACKSPSASRVSRAHPGDPDFFHCKLDFFLPKFAILSPWSSTSPLSRQTRDLRDGQRGWGDVLALSFGSSSRISAGEISRRARPVVWELFKNLCRRISSRASECQGGGLIMAASDLRGL